MLHYYTLRYGSSKKTRYFVPEIPAVHVVTRPRLHHVGDTTLT